MPPPTIAIRTPPSMRPLEASSKPAMTIANSTRPVTNVPVEIDYALEPRLENGSCAQQANAMTSGSKADRAPGCERTTALRTRRCAGRVFQCFMQFNSFL